MDENLESLIKKEKTSFFQRAKSLFYGLAFSLALGTAYCGGNSNNTQAGCRSDADCKGGRICDTQIGECVYPDKWNTGKILFTSDRDGNREIYVMNADGSSQKRLTDHSAEDRSPSWLPDGIVFGTDRDGNKEIYRMGTDGNNLINLTNHPDYDGFPAASPDGRTIAFVSGRSSEYPFSEGIFIMDADGSSLRRLTDNSEEAASSGRSVFDYSPAWSPDSSKIIFASEREGNRNRKLYVMNADGSSIRKLITEGNLPVESEPAYSPDNMRIAFVGSSQSGLVWEIYRANTDGSGIVKLTDTSSVNGYPSWSPDGLEITYSSRLGGGTQIWRMNADGSSQRQLTTIGDNFGPAWSPY